jgi:hypothetical protein
MRRKPKPQKTNELAGCAIIELSEIGRLVDSYKFWSSSFPKTWTFNKREANQPEFWFKAHTLCRQSGMDPELLIYVVHRYLNYNPHDAEVRRFDPLIFRAPRLMQRAIFNLKTRLEAEWKGQHNLHYLMYGTEYHPSPDIRTDLLKALQGASAMLYYFLKFKDLEREHLKKPPFAAEERDLVAYNNCDRNPFAMLYNVTTPRMVALAEVNCWAQGQAYPWYQTVWAGRLYGNRNLTDLRTTCLQDPRPFYLPGGLGESWPGDPLSGKPFAREMDLDPEPHLRFTAGIFDLRLDFFLEELANRARALADVLPPGT